MTLKNHIKFYFQVDKKKASQLASQSAREWLVTNHPDIPHWTDQYRAMFVAYANAFVSNYVAAEKRRLEQEELSRNA
jgi:hypothetical protein